MSDVQARLDALGIQLPTPAAPVATYVPFTRSGRVVYISGQLSSDAAEGIKGTVGLDVPLDMAKEAARLCGINLLAQMRNAAGGSLDRVTRILKLGGFVQAGPDFVDIPAVINGCSDLMLAAFGDRGLHARSAVGVYRLPMGFAVEVDAVIELAE